MTKLPKFSIYLNEAVSDKYIANYKKKQDWMDNYVGYDPDAKYDGPALDIKTDTPDLDANIVLWYDASGNYTGWTTEYYIQKLRKSPPDGYKIGVARWNGFYFIKGDDPIEGSGIYWIIRPRFIEGGKEGAEKIQSLIDKLESGEKNWYGLKDPDAIGSYINYEFPYDYLDEKFKKDFAKELKAVVMKYKEMAIDYLKKEMAS